jgi:hypothetical protein
MTPQEKVKRDLRAARMIASGVDLPTVASKIKVSVKTLYVRGIVAKGRYIASGASPRSACNRAQTPA